MGHRREATPYRRLLRVSHFSGSALHSAARWSPTRPGRPTTPHAPPLLRIRALLLVCVRLARAGTSDCVRREATEGDEANPQKRVAPTGGTHVLFVPTFHGYIRHAPVYAFPYRAVTDACSS